MTLLLFRDDPYLRVAPATVTAVGPDGSVELDRTLFYPSGGGQPGDTGRLRRADGTAAAVTDTVYGSDRVAVLHRVASIDGAPLSPGEVVTMELDWDRRLGRMRVHTALHLLTVALRFPVTGGAIGDRDGRLDFDMPADGCDRATIERDLNALIARDAAVTTEWITDDELLANPGLVKTMAVKPPVGSGRVRLVRIGDMDLQPCGGTHVARTGEIGPIAVTGIEKKGKQNRRVRIALDPAPATSNP